jgi:hypothetical protein
MTVNSEALRRGMGVVVVVVNNEEACDEKEEEFAFVALVLLLLYAPTPTDAGPRPFAVEAKEMEGEQRAAKVGNANEQRNKT